MRRRAFLVLSGGGALAACTATPYASSPPAVLSASPAASGPAARPVGVLLPLSGRLGDIGQPMLRAVQLALSAPGAPRVVSADTLGTAAGAEGAVRTVLGGGAGLILGPLTAGETEAVAPIAGAAAIPVLAFTNTATAARPGVWTLGITPPQQVDRLVGYAVPLGRSRFAALLPDSEFGNAMARALSEAATARGLAAPAVQFHARGGDAVSAALQALTGAGAPPAFNILLLGDTGAALAEVAAALPAASVAAPAVQLIGPALWAAPASGSDQVPGGWYAAPDPAARLAFARAFTAKYAAAPPGPADLAYDAASIARVLAPRDYARAALTNQAGFAGVDGWLRLLPDGRVQRGLAVFQVQADGARIISAAPTTASAYAA